MLKALMIILTFMSNETWAYKCVINGKVKYQQLPCIEGTRIPMSDATISIVNSREAEQKWFDSEISRRTDPMFQQKKNVYTIDGGSNRKKSDKRTEKKP